MPAWQWPPGRKRGRGRDSSWENVVRGRVAVVVADIGRRHQVQVLAVVAENSTAQAAGCLGAGRPQALEFDLELDRVVQVALEIADVAARHQAGGHAAAVPLDACE